MTKIAFLADCHLGNHRRFGGPVESGLNRRCRQVATALRRACTVASLSGAEYLVVLGDLFDSAKPEPQVIAAAMDAMATGPKHRILLCGNHDANSDLPGDHALAPFAFVPGYVVVDRPTRLLLGDAGDVELLCVPHRPGTASEWLPEVVQSLSQPAGEDPAARAGHRRVLALHLGIRDDATPPYLATSPGAYDAEALAHLCAAHGIDEAFAGDWHTARDWELYPGPSAVVTLCQLGALAPTGFDNPGIAGYGRVATLEVTPGDAAFAVREVPGPRFVSVRSERDARKAAEFRGEHELYLNWVVSDANDLSAAATTLRDAVGMGAFVDAEASVDGTQVRAIASQAAHAARAAESVGEALAKFVETMSLPLGVTPTEVVERVSRYLAANP